MALPENTHNMLKSVIYEINQHIYSESHMPESSEKQLKTRLKQVGDELDECQQHLESMRSRMDGCRVAIR